VKKHRNSLIGGLILWNSPIHSALLLAFGISLYVMKFVLIHRFGYTVPTLICRAFQIGIIVAGLVHAFTHKELNAAQYREFAERALRNLTAPLTNCVALLCYVMQWKNKNTTFEALLLLQLASWLFNVLSISTVVLILFITTMTLPALYELKRPAIEEFVHKECNHISRKVEHLCDSLPPAIHTQLTKLGIVLPTQHASTETLQKAENARKGATATARSRKME